MQRRGQMRSNGIGGCGSADAGSHCSAQRCTPTHLGTPYPPVLRPRHMLKGARPSGGLSPDATPVATTARNAASITAGGLVSGQRLQLRGAEAAGGTTITVVPLPVWPVSPVLPVAPVAPVAPV